MPQALGPRSDLETATAFSTSWNNLPGGSIYSRDQFLDWMAPLSRQDIAGASVLELGCGNGSLLVHLADWQPAQVCGVDLGSSVLSARQNLAGRTDVPWNVLQADLTTYSGPGADITICIGVLHHLQRPEDGFASVIRNTRPGGRFHCWVYAREGNDLVISLVDPLRRLFSHFPWWFTKYLVATPLSILFYIYAKMIVPRRALAALPLPLREYCMWIRRRELAFFRHVSFDQLVTPQTTYIPQTTIRGWLAHPDIEPGSTYMIFRNGNSWKFGGRRRSSALT